MDLTGLVLGLVIGGAVLVFAGQRCYVAWFQPERLAKSLRQADTQRGLLHFSSGDDRTPLLEMRFGMSLLLLTSLFTVGYCLIGLVRLIQ